MMVSATLDTLPKLSSSFTPPVAKFRSVISSDPSSEFPAEPDRYALYLHLGCPWVHRANIVYQLKRLQPIVARSIVSIHRDGSNGWSYDGTSGSEKVDSIEGFKNFKELYEKSDPSFEGDYNAPLIWDRKKKTIVNNDSADIIRMFFTAFDAFLAPELREVNKPGGGLRPKHLENEIDELNNAIEIDYCWGTYKCGLAASQADYNKSMKSLFGRLDNLEERLGGSKYLLGDHITEPDIRLFTPTVRFDMVYYTIFNCNWKQIRSDFPNIHRWLRDLYWEVDEEAKGAFQSTTHFELFMEGYAKNAMKKDLVPWGPAHPILPLAA